MIVPVAGARCRFMPQLRSSAGSLRFEFPAKGMDPDAAYELLRTVLMLDGRPALNLASFVTTWMEPQAEALIHETLRKNHIDHDEYPAASLVEEACVHMLGALFHAPDPADVVGVATIGSSEAIMLGLLAHKWSWRARREAAGEDTARPNVVFGAETHVVWDKFAKYFDVEMRKIPMKPDRWVLAAEDVAAAGRREHDCGGSRPRNDPHRRGRPHQGDQ